jgi:hypothetical protein
MEFLLKMWVEYLQVTKSLGGYQVEIYEKWIGNQEKINSNQKNQCSLNSLNLLDATIHVTRKAEAYNVSVFVPVSWKFSYFVQGVMKNEINIDNLVVFRQFTRDHSNNTGSDIDKVETEGEPVKNVSTMHLKKFGAYFILLYNVGNILIIFH